MESLLDAGVAMIALLCAVLLLYGAWLCLSPFQPKRSAGGAAPTSLRKYLRSVSDRFSASSW